MLLLVVAVALLVTFRYFRRSAADAPGWLYAVAVVVVPVCIWVDIKRRQRDD